MYDKPYVDKAIVRLHTTISYNVLYFVYDKQRSDKAIVRLHTTISYNILFYMYDKVILYYNLRVF